MSSVPSVVESSASASSEAAVVARSLSITVPDARKRGATKDLLRGIDFEIPGGSFTVVIGPSGCGKTTLIRTLGGMLRTTKGKVWLAGHDPATLRSQLPLAIGYLPQFAAFHESLTVAEILDNALALRLPASVPKDQRRQWLAKIIGLTGLESQLQQESATLSGGQKRRLALAEELLGDPQFLLLDELTSGLDPHSEREMMRWLRDLVDQTGKTVVMVTHSVTNLEGCDQLLFLHDGCLLFASAPDQLLPAFGFPTIEDVYAQADNFEALSGDPMQEAPPTGVAPTPQPQPLRTARPASALAQFPSLLKRQVKLFLRDKGQLWLHLLLMLSFPVLVAVFAVSGLPAVRNLSMGVETSVIESLTERLKYLTESFDVAALVQGLAMFQVILLTLMGANNGAREIARERAILDKELRAGLSPTSYLATKVMQVGLFSLLQSFWMAWFVKQMCGFPGSFGAQFLALFMPTLAMSTTCLFFSAISRTPEKASLLSIYLVGLQLPLSGAVLAMPELLQWVTRPIIAAYWGWSGYLRTLESFRHYDVVQQATKTDIADFVAGIVVLGLHVVVTVVAAWGVVRKGK